jgi:hypothetical protein
MTALKFEICKTYVVTESFATSVLNDHEVGGSWSDGRIVPLDPGNKFTIISHKDDGSGWSMAQMDHKLWFESQENPGGSFSWKGQFYVRGDAHGKKVEIS